MRSNREIVLSIYEAFGRGDAPAMLSHMAAGVEWEYQGSPCPVPWLARGSGQEHVMSFLSCLAEQTQVETFRVNEVLAAGSTVVALIQITLLVKATGKRIIEYDEPHLWRLNEEGKVVQFRHAADTYQHFMAWRND